MVWCADTLILTIIYAPKYKRSGKKLWILPEICCTRRWNCLSAPESNECVMTILCRCIHLYSQRPMSLSFRSVPRKFCCWLNWCDARRHQNLHQVCNNLYSLHHILYVAKIIFNSNRCWKKNKVVINYQ